jgi:hypothetical protein
MRACHLCLGCKCLRHFSIAQGGCPGVSKGILKRAVKVAPLEDRVRAILKPERFEPDWVYSQAQRFAASFMIPRARLQESLKENPDFVSSPNWQAIYDLARRCATSPSMMQYRLEQLGYIVVHGTNITHGISLRQRRLL